MEKNQNVRLSITDLSDEGLGIGKADGFTLFVKDAIPGDEIEAGITKVKKNYGFARVEKVITPSPFRMEAPCAYHRSCGGCQIQTMDYAAQLDFKRNKVRSDLIRIGGFDEKLVDEVMEPIVGMDDPYRYRNKAQFPFGTNNDNCVITGFYAGRTHHIIANTDCLLGVEENEEILRTILDFMKEFHITAYDEESGRGYLRHVLIRKGFASGQLMVCLVVNAEKLPKEEILAQRLSRIRGMTSVTLNVNTDRTNVILGRKVRLLLGERTIEDVLKVYAVEGGESIREVRFKISPLSFYQVNPVQTEKLYSLALQYAGLTGKEEVLDLYCGIGTISLFLAGNAGHVTGIEVVEDAVRDAEENARLNHIENAHFLAGKAEELLPEMYKRGDLRADVIVTDPPRKGCDEACLSTILSLHPERIVYVSCNPSTLARDLKTLCAGGYELRRVRPVDQFPHTVHVETVCLLSNRKPDSYVHLNLKMEDYYRIKDAEKEQGKK